MNRPPSSNALDAPATDPWIGIRLTRLGIALHSLILSLEAAAYEASDDSLLDPGGWGALAEKVPARFAACVELLGAVRGARLPADAERARAMRECFEALKSAHDAFRSDLDRTAGARALLVTVRATKARADAWSE